MDSTIILIHLTSITFQFPGKKRFLIPYTERICEWEENKDTVCWDILLKLLTTSPPLHCEYLNRSTIYRWA